MKPPPSRFWDVFFDVYEHLPRQGPGNLACTARALAICRHLPPQPRVLDLGCGSGKQTLDLAALTPGEILAIDSHAPFIERLQAVLAGQGLAPRVQAQVGDMTRLDLPPRSLDLVWSEGALYNMGIPNAIRMVRALLKPGGYLAFTDAVWRKENPPAAVKATFDLDYPSMGRVEDGLAAIREAGFEICGHFTLPDEAWWDDFYTPMEARTKALRDRYSGDAEALAALEEIAREPEMHRQYSAYYAYEFFVTRRDA